MYDYFTSVPRVIQWNPAAFPMKMEQSHYRYFKWHLDLGKKADVDSISQMVIRLFKRDRENQIKCHAFFEKLQILPLIEQFCASRPQGALQPDYVDLYYLYSHVLETRPKTVLELGSGISTVVIAAALRHNGEGRLYAVDPHQKWAVSTAQSIPCELKEWCEVAWSDSEPVKHLGYDTSRFKTLPVAHADMVYLDAAHASAVFRGAETVQAMYPRFKGGESILVDGRWEAIEFFTRKPQSYDVTAYANVFVVPQVDGATAVGAPFGLDLFTNAIVTVRQPAHA